MTDPNNQWQKGPQHTCHGRQADRQAGHLSNTVLIDHHWQWASTLIFISCSITILYQSHFILYLSHFMQQYPLYEVHHNGAHPLIHHWGVGHRCRITCPATDKWWHLHIHEGHQHVHSGRYGMIRGVISRRRERDGQSERGHKTKE